MTISFSRYVGITSGVIGASPVPTRQLIGRCFTSNPLLPSGVFAEFTSADDVGAYFGTASNEYKRAVFYFGWVSPAITRAQKLSFARWVNAPCAPQVFGNQATKSLSAFNAITAGTFSLTMGGVTHTLGPVDLSAAGSFNAVAAAIQSAVNGQSGTLWTAATVAYNSTTDSFVLTGGVTGAASLAVVDGSQSLATVLGWLPQIPTSGERITAPQLSTYAIWAPGAALETISAALGGSANASNNFGSFLVMPSMTTDEISEASAWCADQNVQFRYCVPVTVSNADDVSTAVIGNAGTDLVLSPLGGEFPEMVPMIQMAATDYDAANSASNYMFKQFNLTPSVSSDADADTYDGLRVNYYGVTQSAGAQIAFYQRGRMCGTAADPLDENVFSNEAWLKSAAGAAVINLQLGLAQIPANVSGANKITNALQGVVEQGLSNGTISVGKPLTAEQQSAVTDFTDDVNAWRQVQNSGYWLGVTIAPYTDDTTNTTGYEAVYTLAYSKDDVVRFVSGRHGLV